MNNSPYATSAHPAPITTVKGWRLQLLNNILRATFGLTTLAIIYTCIKAINAGRYQLLAIYLGVYLALALASFLKPNEYNFRAGLLVTLFYAVGAIELAQAGVWSNGALFLFGFVIVTAILFNLYASLGAVILSLATTAAFGWLAVGQNYQFPLANDYANSAISAWIRILVVLAFLSGIVILAVRQLVRHDLNYYWQAEQEKERLLLAEREQRKLADALRQASFALSATLNMDTLLDHLLEYVGNVVPCDASNIMMIKNDTATVVRTRGYRQFGPQVQQALLSFSYPLNKVPNLKQMVDTGRPHLVADTYADPNWLTVLPEPCLRSWVGAPITAKNVTTALFSLDKVEPGYYHTQHLETLGIFAAHASLAMENARLFNAEARRRQEAETLYQATIAVNSTPELADVLDNILNQLERVLPYDSACIFMLQENGLHSVAGRGFSQPEKVINKTYPATDALTQGMLQNHQPVLLQNASENPHFKQFGGTHNVKGWLAVPLLDRQEVIGVLTLDSFTPDAYTPADLPLVQAFASQAAVALSKAHLLQEAREAHRLSDMLRESVAALVGSRNEDKVLQGILDYLGKVVPYDSASIMLVEGNSNTLRIKAGRGIAADSLVWTIDFPIGDEGKNYDIVYNKMSVIMSNVRTDPRWTIIEGDSYINSWMGIPLIKDDTVMGVLTLDHHQEGFFTHPHLALAQSFAQHAAIALENARLFSVVNHRLGQLEAIRQATLTLTSSLELQEVLEKILEIIFHFTPQASKANIFLYQHRYLTFGASFFEGGIVDEPRVNARENGLAYAVAHEADLMLIPGIHEYGGYPEPNGHNFEPDEEDAIAGLPLKIGNTVVGVMTVSSKRSGDWPADELDLLKLLADQAAIAIENARLYNEVQTYAADLEEVITARTFELKTLYMLAQALSRANRFDDAVELVINHLEKVIPFDAAACLLQLETTPHLYLASPFCLTEEQEQKILRELQWISGIPQAQQPAATPPTTTYLHPVPDSTLPPIKFMANAAIVAGQKRLGALVIVSHATPFSAEHSRLLHTMADQVAETIGRLQLLVAAEHERLENLIAYLPTGVLLLNPEQRIVLANLVAKDLMPALTQAGVGDKLVSLGGHPLEDILTQADSDTPFSLFAGHPYGTQFEVDVNLVTAGPEAGGWILVIRDVTEREYLQKQIRQQERVAAVGELAAGIAHDFNNILTSIIGFAELILLEELLPPQIRDDVQRIASQGHRAAHLVRQILDFSRQTISEKKPLDLVPLLQETIKLLKRTLPEDIYIAFLPPPEGIFIAQIDFNQVQQVLTNLAVNARDAMPNGGQLTFKLSSQIDSQELNSVVAAPTSAHPNHWIVVEISDTGMGISPETQSKIFEPFFTTKEVGKGTGLGLAQVYGIMKQHQGHIKVSSSLEQGTTFFLYFPVMTEAKDSLAFDFTTTSIPTGQQELILLVEDDATVLEIGTSLLEHLNYRVISARNGVKALELFEQYYDDISLVLTDLTMPKMGGAELTRAIRQKDPNVKIIAMTGYPRFQADKDLVSNNIVGWLQKPLSLEILAVTLHKTLQGEQNG